MNMFFFFFQAEDGIRDAQESRGLGDVYKRQVHLELEPGDISVHHPAILHGSDSNLSNQRRCGLNIRYVAGSTRVVQDLGDDLFFMRGKPDHEVNKYRAWPEWKQGQHMEFRGCTEWNHERQQRQGEGVEELTEEQQRKRERLVDYFVQLSSRMASVRQVANGMIGGRQCVL
eukprot:TRINITY_DN6800_c0_g1_i1.p1 TRINITY_DN6800_c0_g1~~TRINITY_DN6800_c0_g1_i1.p1  ORF type:complete len:172 (-),score=55.49 TRINITY_DN6800_c0_g1_i1:231-746(-)